LVFLGICVALPAGAKESLKDRKAKKKAMEALSSSSSVKRAGEKCGVDFKVTVDWKSFTGKYDGSYTHRSAVSYCESVFDGLRHTCGDELGKEAVAEKIKSVHCSWDPKANKDELKRYGPQLKFNGKKLNAGVSWKTANISSATKEWLMDNL
jgi:hypothetical protein